MAIFAPAESLPSPATLNHRDYHDLHDQQYVFGINQTKILTAGFGVAHVAEDLLADENCFKK